MALLLLELAPGNVQPVVPRVRRRLGRFPTPTGQEVAVLEAEDLDLEGAAALDHLLFAVGAETPEGEVAARAGAFVSLLVLVEGLGGKKKTKTRRGGEK